MTNNAPNLNSLREDQNEAAAWRWLDMRQSILSLEDFDDFKQQYGGEGHSREGFARKVLDKCNAIKSDHPKLSNWIANRTALLELISEPPGASVPKELRFAVMTYRRILMEAVSHLAEAKLSLRYQKEDADAKFDKTYGTASLVLAQSLFGAALMAQDLLSNKEECALSANLMVPVKSAQLDKLTEQTIMHRAKFVWSELRERSDKFLVVVAETRNARNLGFWVPLVLGEQGQTIPGAARAFQTGSSSSVFKADLPDLDGFSPELDKRWKADLIESVPEKMFVSLPLRLPIIGQEKSEIVAVLNINVNAENELPWARAYHSDWLSIASERASQFIEVALYAWLIRTSVENCRGETFEPDFPPGLWYD
jgi:hypothetical protein